MYFSVLNVSLYFRGSTSSIAVNSGAKSSSVTCSSDVVDLHSGMDTNMLVLEHKCFLAGYCKFVRIL